ncbi:MAG: CpcT/CpeT family chromophore lyase, partial [Gammaproteobacteria bacterium]
MKLKKYPLLALTSLFLAGCDSPADPATPGEKTLGLVKAWVNGYYHNVAQAEADMASDLPPEQMHRPMHQLFVPVSVPSIDGYIVYQQSSLDGSETPAMIFRHGLMLYIPDQNSDALLQRELYFKDAELYKNAHRNPEILKDITLEDVTWDTGCDFYLTTSEDGKLVSGPLIDGACVMFNPGLQKDMYADDVVEITANEYRFRGRFVDEDGNVLWGTESDVLNTLIRQDN